jgi:hypothetical protein
MTDELTLHDLRNALAADATKRAESCTAKAIATDTGEDHGLAALAHHIASKRHREALNANRGVRQESCDPEHRRKVFGSLTAGWGEGELSIIHKLANELKPHDSEPGDEKWRERVEETQKRFLQELDELARKLIDAEPSRALAKAFANWWVDQRCRMQIEHYLRRRVTDADRAFDRELCESWVRAEESLMDKLGETLRKRAAEREAAQREPEPKDPAD